MSHFSSPERERIQKLIADAHTEAVFHALEQAGLPGVQAMKEQFNAIHEAHENGLITLQERLQGSVLVLANAWLQTGVTERTPAELPARSVVEELVIRHRLEEAIRLCEPLGDAVLLLQAEYALLQQWKDDPKVESAAWELAMERLRYALMEQAKELPKIAGVTTRNTCFDRLRRFVAGRFFL